MEFPHPMSKAATPQPDPIYGVVLSVETFDYLLGLAPTAPGSARDKHLIDIKRYAPRVERIDGGSTWREMP